MRGTLLLSIPCIAWIPGCSRPLEAAGGAEEGAAVAPVEDLRAELEGLLRRIETVESRLTRVEESDVLQEDLGAEGLLRRIRQMGVGRRSFAGTARMRSFLERYPLHDEASWIAHECVAAYLYTSRPALARELIEERVELEGETYQLRFDLGAVLLEERELEAAQEHFQRLAAAPANTDFQRLQALFYVAFAQLERGQYAEATELFDQVIAGAASSSDPDLIALAKGAELQKQRASQWSGDE